MEVESHLFVAADLGYLSPKAREHTLAEVQAIQRMLAGLMKKVP